ncbi:unnamed protein product [Closterium sp. NIES-64]|nr:unnamed protein product [Closterium sp. NIES-64]
MAGPEGEEEKEETSAKLVTDVAAASCSGPSLPLTGPPPPFPKWPAAALKRPVAARSAAARRRPPTAAACRRPKAARRRPIPSGLPPPYSGPSPPYPQRPAATLARPVVARLCGGLAALTAASPPSLQSRRLVLPPRRPSTAASAAVTCGLAALYCGLAASHLLQRRAALQQHRRAARAPEHSAAEPPCSRAAEQPSHPVAEPPSSRAAQQPSRPAAEPPSSRAALQPSHRAAPQPSRRAALLPTCLSCPSTVVMATPSVLAFDAEGRAIDFEVWVDDLQLFLQCDRADGLSLFDLTSGASPAPSADADATVRSQWATRDAAARLAVRRHLPTSERAHFSQYKSAQTLYDAVVARYSSPATAALSRLMLPYLFPDLAAFPTVADLITHLRTSDTRYRAALPADFCAKNPPPPCTSPSTS